VRLGRVGPGFREGAAGPYRGIEVTAGESRRRLEAPTGLATIVFGFGDPLHIESAAGPPYAVEARSIVSVPHETAHIGVHSGQIRCLEVVLTPVAAARVLGLPMTDFDQPIHELETVLGRCAVELVERLAEADDWNARFDLVEGFLTERLHARSPCPPAVAEAWRRLQANPAPRIEQLCRELGWSSRQLRRLFEQHVGMTPGQVAAVARVQRALRAEATGMSLADVAHVAGYHDHPHLVRGFSNLIGMAPGRYRALRTAGGGKDALTSRVPRRVTGLLLAPTEPAESARAADRAGAGPD
jgi:AraC-like DNA-binding protein